MRNQGPGTTSHGIGIGTVFEDQGSDHYASCACLLTVLPVACRCFLKKLKVTPHETVSSRNFITTEQRHTSVRPATYFYNCFVICKSLIMYKLIIYTRFYRISRNRNTDSVFYNDWYC